MCRAPGSRLRPAPHVLFDLALVCERLVELRLVLRCPRRVAFKAAPPRILTDGIREQLFDKRVDATACAGTHLIELERDLVGDSADRELLCHAGMIARICL